jgi:hypothetical protein
VMKIWKVLEGTNESVDSDFGEWLQRAFSGNSLQDSLFLEPVRRIVPGSSLRVPIAKLVERLEVLTAGFNSC